MESYLGGSDPMDDEPEQLLQKLLDLMDNHPVAKRFPISPVQRAGTVKWLEETFEKKLSCEGSEVLDQEPEFVFKSFERSGGSFVTLLEENRELIGRGTTGLTSWQGAMFLADWAQNQGFHHLKVNFNVNHHLHINNRSSGGYSNIKGAAAPATALDVANAAAVAAAAVLIAASFLRLLLMLLQP